MIIITDNNDSTLYNFAIKNKIKVVEHNSPGMNFQGTAEWLRDAILKSSLK